jgi:rod shape-determining protein MreD
MKSVRAFFALWIGLIFQSTLFQIPPLNAIHPDFVLVGLVLVALTRSTRSVLVLALLVGLIQDIVFGSFIGLNAFSYAVIGYFAAAIFAQFLHKNLAITFVVTVVCTFLHEWLTFGLTRMFGVTAYSGRAVLATSLEQMFINGILLLLLYPLAVRWLKDRSTGKYGETDSEVTAK